MTNNEMENTSTLKYILKFATKKKFLLNRKNKVNTFEKYTILSHVRSYRKLSFTFLFHQ